MTEEKKKHTLSMIGREHEHGRHVDGRILFAGDSNVQRKIEDACSRPFHLPVVENFLRDLEKRAKASGGDVDDNGDEDSEDDEPDFDANAEA